MTQSWTTQRVLALSPDAGSTKAGQGLAKAAKWSLLGRRDQALWGEIKGSGAEPYRTRVDLSEPAFKCSCPSRKFPCKHALGLLLVLAEQPEAVAEDDPPDWVAEWLSQRQGRAARQAEKAEQAATAPADAQAQAKRAAAREAKVAAGLEELSLWLADLVRRGLAAAPAEPAGFWESPARRMVDAQAPGVARLVRELGETAASGPGWQQRLLARLGRLHLLIEAYRRLDRLDPGAAAEVRGLIGWTQNQDELLRQPGERGTWQVVGQTVEQEQRLRVQRTWLVRREDGRPALVLSFAAGNQPLDASLPVGGGFEGEVVHFPGAVPLRAMVKERGKASAGPAEFPGLSITDSLREYAQALARNPWLESWPMRLAGVVPLPPDDEGKGDAGRWRVGDAAGNVLPLPARLAGGWELRAISGGEPIDLFGEWDGEALRPLSVRSEAGFFAIGRREEMPVVRVSEGGEA